MSPIAAWCSCPSSRRAARWVAPRGAPGSDATIGAGTGYGAGNGALIRTGIDAAAGAIHDTIKKLTLGVMKIWAVRLGIATPLLLWSGALGQAATPLAHQGATPRMVKGQIIVRAVVLLVFIPSSPAVPAQPFAGSVLLADGRSTAMLQLEGDAVGVVSTRVKGDLQRFNASTARPERGAARSSIKVKKRLVADLIPPGAAKSQLH